MFTPEQLFVRNIDYLRYAVANPSLDTLFEASGKLRQLLTDKNALIHTANRKHRLKITFPMKAWDDLPSLYGDEGPPIRILKLDDFLAETVLWLNMEYISVLGHIQYWANYAGAIHSNPPDNNVRELLEGYGHHLEVEGIPASLYPIKKIARAAVDGSTPLYEAIVNGAPG